MKNYSLIVGSLLLLLPGLTVQAQEPEGFVSRMEFRTYVERTGSLRDYESDTVDVKIEGSKLRVVGHFRSGNPEKSPYQDLILEINDFDGRGTYSVDAKRAMWQNLAGERDTCYGVSGQMTVFSYDPETGIDGSFEFRCETEFRSGTSTFTRIRGTFVKGLEPKIVTPAEEDTVELYEEATIEWVLPGRDLVDIYVVYEPDPLRPEILQYPVAEDVDASLGSYTWELPDSMSPQVYLLIFDDLDPESPIVSDPFVVRGPWAARVSEDPGGECPGCPYYEVFLPSKHGFAHGNFEQNFGTRNRSDFPERFDYDGGDDPFSILPYNFSSYIPPDINYAGSGSFPEWENWVRAFGTDQCYLLLDNGERVPRTDVVRLWAIYTGEWNGSCFGLSVGSAMAFYDPDRFSSVFSASVPGGSADRINTVPLTTALKDDISMMFAHQFGAGFQNELRDGNPSVYEVRELFDRLLRQDAVDASISGNLLIGIRDDGGHALTAYGLVQDEENESLWYLLVYDSNHPGDDDRAVVLDLDLGLWTYDLSATERWSGLEIEVADDLINYFGRAEIEFDRIFADVKASFRYSLGVQATDSSGSRFSISSNGAFDSTGRSAHPLYPFAGPGRPYAVRLESSQWWAELKPESDSGASMVIETVPHLLYFGSDATIGETDVVRFDETSITAFNPDETPRTITFDVVYRLDSETRTLGVTDLTLAGGDSIRFAIAEDDLVVDNYGAATTYTIIVRQQKGDGEFEGDYDPVDIGAGSRHRIDPPWWNIGTRLPIYVADGEGSESDTIIRINSLLGVDRDRLVEGPVRITNPIGDLGSLQLDLKRPGVVRIDVFDGLGRTAGTLFEGMQRRGSSAIPIDASGLAPGVWMLRVSLDGNVVATERVVRIE